MNDMMSALEEMRFQSIQALRCENCEEVQAALWCQTCEVAACQSCMDGDPWREDSATPHPGSCQRPVEAP